MNKSELKENEFICCICGEQGIWGRNPSPVKDKDGNELGLNGEECCEKCDNEIVIPSRLKSLAYQRVLEKFIPSN